MNFRDVTGRRRAEEALREGEGRYRAVVEQAAEGIFLFDPESKLILEANPAFCRMLGYAPQELARKTVYDLVPHDPESVDRHAARAIGEGHAVVGERRYRREDGSVVDVEVSGSAISYGGREAICAVVRDVSERKRAEEEVRRSERELAEAQRIARVGSFAYSVADDRARWSDEMYRIAGVAPQSFVPTYKRFLGLVHPDDRGLFRGEVREALYGGGRRRGLDYRLVRPDGGVRRVRSEFEVQRDGSGRPARLAGTSQDVTERWALEEELRHRALHDDLTGLANRALFTDRLSHALTRREERSGGGAGVAVLFLDLDNFKYVNDSLGHGAGDRLLVAVAGRLQKVLRTSDTAARLGGDEFVVLLEDIGGEAEAVRVAERIAKALEGPFALDGHDSFVTASVGIALGERGADPAGAAADLLRRADLAMYEAKRAGKARHALFHPEAERRSVRRLGLENGLRRALERDELVVHYQPVVSLRDGRVKGMEALVRWEHPERGLIPPGEFVPLAEETGLIVRLGSRVLGEACRRAKEWQGLFSAAGEPLRPGETSPIVGVNLSAKELGHPDLVGEVAQALGEAGLDPGLLTLEVTESALLGDEEHAADALGRLRALGAWVVLDDFGTGYSSLSYLRSLPLDMLKVAGTFVGGLAEGDGRAEALLSGMVGIAHGLGLRVVAEGVETAEQLERLRAMGCDLAQGYLFSRPLTAEGASALLAEGPRWP